MSRKFIKIVVTQLTYCVILCLFSPSVHCEETTAPIEAPTAVEDPLFLPNFRAGHHLSLFLSGEYVQWNLTQMPSPAGPALSLDGSHESRGVAAIFLRYAYHTHVIGPFGFFVGSTLGTWLSNGYYGIQKNLYPGYGVGFPTVLGGLTQGISHNIRFLEGIEYGAAWFPEMTVITQTGASQRLNLVPDMYAVFGGMDYFLTRNTAFLFQVGYRQIRNSCFSSCAIYANKLQLSSKSTYAQMGITWLLDTLHSE